MTDETKPSESSATVTLLMTWFEPYEGAAHVDVYVLRVGPFYAGEVCPHPDHGWRMTDVMNSHATWFKTKEEAMVHLVNAVLEHAVKLESRGLIPDV